jgi:tetratricopeptide (TPR) repeat protein
VQLKPDDVELWVKLGAVLAEFGRPADALMTYQHALKLGPRRWDAVYGRGSILHQLERFEEAIKQFDLCGELRPNHASTLQLCGLSLRGLSRFEEYLADSMVAHALDPDSRNAHQYRQRAAVAWPVCRGAGMVRRGS